MKIYDCFTFFNEFELLELRLKSLWNMVDYFVLVEADKTQNNQPKPFYFGERITEFKEFMPKIRYIPFNVDVAYKGTGDWSIENAQRNAIMYGIMDAAPDDLIFISDVDEIPNPDILQRIDANSVQVFGQLPLMSLNDGNRMLAPCQVLFPAAGLLEYTPLIMEQNFHYYYLDFVAEKNWLGTALVKRKNLKMPQEIRNLREFLPHIPDGGWHFSYMGGVDKIIKKMTSIVEGNEAIKRSPKNLISKVHVKECMRTGKDIYDRKGNSEIKFTPYDILKINLPYLKEFVKKYPYFLREYDFGKDDV